jgi:hypothetical protein
MLVVMFFPALDTFFFFFLEEEEEEEEDGLTGDWLALLGLLKSPKDREDCCCDAGGGPLVLAYTAEVAAEDEDTRAWPCAWLCR